MVDAESAMQSLFDHTADVKAQNRLLLWYTLMLTHIQGEDLDEEPVSLLQWGRLSSKRLEDYYLKGGRN